MSLSRSLSPRVRYTGSTLRWALSWLVLHLSSSAQTIGGVYVCVCLSALIQPSLWHKLLTSHTETPGAALLSTNAALRSEKAAWWQLTKESRLGVGDVKRADTRRMEVKALCADAWPFFPAFYEPHKEHSKVTAERCHYFQLDIWQVKMIRKPADFVNELQKINELFFKMRTLVSFQSLTRHLLLNMCANMMNKSSTPKGVIDKAELLGVKLWQISHEPNSRRKHPAQRALVSHFRAFSRLTVRSIRWMCLISHPPPLTPYTLVQHGDVRLPSNLYSESSATFQWDFPHTCETQELKKTMQMSAATKHV